MRSFKEIYRLSEDVLPTTINHPTMKLAANKGYEFIITPPDSGSQPKDVMKGLPDDSYVAYGRFGVLRGQLYVTGGPNGDPNGAHKDGTEMGGYWGAKDLPDGKTAIVVRSRVGKADEARIKKMEIPLVNEILRKVPKV